MKVSYADLVKEGACFEERAWFRFLWPRACRTGVTVNRANLLRAARHQLMITWIVRYFPRRIQTWYWKHYTSKTMPVNQKINLLLEGAAMTDAWHEAHPSKKRKK